MWREQRGLVLIEVILYSFVILSILDRIAFVNLFCYDFIIFLYLLLYCISSTKKLLTESSALFCFPLGTFLWGWLWQRDTSKNHF